LDKKGEEVVITDNRGIEQATKVSRISSFVDEATQSVYVYLTYIATKIINCLRVSMLM